MSAQRVNDVYSELAKITATDTQQLATAMTKTASIAYSANMQFENVSAFLAQILETTQEAPETAGTAMKTIIGRFTEIKKLYSTNQLIGKDSEGEEIQVNKVATALSAAGINLNEFFTGAKGLDEILYQLSQRWDTLDVTVQRYIATQAAGSRQQSRFIALMQNNARLTELMNAAKDSKGSAEGQFEKTLDSLDAKVNKLRDAWEEFLMGIANSDLIKGSIDLLTKLLEVINKLTKGTGGLDSAFMKLAVVGTALQLGGGLLQGGLGYFNARRYTVQAKGMAKTGIDQDTIKAVSNGFTGKEKIGSVWSYLGGGLANFGNLGFIGMVKDMFKGLFTGVKGIFTSTLDKTGKAVLENSITKFITDSAAKTQFTANMAKQLAKSQQVDIAQGTNLYASMLMATGGNASYWGQFKAGKNFTKQLTEMTGKTQSYTSAVAAMNAANGGSVTVLAKLGALFATLGPAVWVVVAAIGALVAIGLVAYFNSINYKIKQLNKRINELNETLAEGKENLDALIDYKASSNSLNEELSKLTRGTVEFNEKLIEANQLVLDLLEKYPNLKLGGVGEYGQLTIDSASYEAVIAAEQKAYMILQNSKLEMEAQNQTLEAQKKLQNTPYNAQYRSNYERDSNGNQTSTYQGGTAYLTQLWKEYKKLPLNQQTSFTYYVEQYYTDQNGQSLIEDEYRQPLLQAANNYEQAQNTVEQAKENEQDIILNNYLSMNDKNLTDQQKEEIQRYNDVLVQNTTIDPESGNEFRKQLKKAYKIKSDTWEGIYKEIFNVDDLPEILKDESGEPDSKQIRQAIATQLSIKILDDTYNALSNALDEIEKTTPNSMPLVNAMLEGSVTQAQANKLKDWREQGDNNEIISKIAESLNYDSVEQFWTEIGSGVIESSEKALSEAKRDLSVLFGDVGLFTSNRINSVLDQLDGQTALQFATLLNDVNASYGTSGVLSFLDDILSATGIGIEKKAKLIQKMASADLKDIDSIKLLTKELVEEGIITDDVSDKVATAIIRLNNAAKNFDISALIDSFQQASKTIKNIRLGEQQYTFNEDEKDALIKLLPANEDWESQFVQDLDGNYIYIGSRMDDLSLALNNNTKALLKEGVGQLEQKQLLGEELNSWSWLSPEYLNQLANSDNYMEQQSILKWISAGINQDPTGQVAEWAKSVGLGDLTIDWDDLNWTKDKTKEKASNALRGAALVMEQSTTTDKNGQPIQSSYESQIDSTNKQFAIIDAQSLNPLIAKEKIYSAVSSNDTTSAVGYGQGLLARARAYQDEGVEGVNNDTIESFANLNKQWEQGAIDQGTYLQGVSNIANMLSTIEGNKNLEKVRDTIAGLNNEMTDTNKIAKYSQLAQELTQMLGVQVDTGWVEKNFANIKNWVENGTDGIEKMRKELIKIQDIEIDPIEINTILSTGDALDKINGLANYLGNLTGQNYNLNITGTANMQDIVNNIGTVIMQLAMIKAAASGDSEKAIQIMENAQTVIEQIAEAMGFEMTTNYDMKEIKSNFQNYEFKTTGSPETGDLKGGWVKAGTTTFPVGQEISWSFQPKKGTFSGSGSSAVSTTSSGRVVSSLSQDSTTGEVSITHNSLNGISKKELSNGITTNETKGDLRGGKSFANIDWNLVSDLFGGFIYNNSKIQPTSPPPTYGDKDLNKGGGSGSGSKDSPSNNDEDKWENSYDWLYNLTQDINAELEKREKLELKYNNILKDRNKTAKELYQNAKAQLASLEKSRNLNAEAYEKRKTELQLEAKQATAQYTNDTRFNMKWGTGLASGKGSSSGLKVINLAGSGGGNSEDVKKDQGKRTMLSEAELGRYATFNWDDNTVEINWDAINKISDQQKGEAVEDYISKLEEIQEKMNEAEKSLLEIDGKIREIIDQGKDEFKDFEQQIFDALVSRYQKEIDKLTEISEAITDANSKLIDSMTNAIDKEREARDNEKTETELADKQKRLDYLRSDTSNANAKQILDLEKELAEGQEDYTDQLIDQKIDELKEQNDKASEQRQVQIDLMTKNLEMAQETGALWQEVYNLMDIGVDQEGALVKQSELFDLLQSEAGWQGMSAVSKMTWLDELTETVKAGMAYLMTGRQLEYIGTEAGKQITFSAYDEQGKLQWLTGTVDKNGDVVDSNGVRYSEIFQNYDGSFTTMETAGVGTKKEPPKPEVKPSTPSSSSNNTGSSRGTGTTPRINLSGSNGIILNADGSNSGISVWDPGQGISNAELRAARDLGNLGQYDANQNGLIDKKELSNALKKEKINPNDSKYQMEYDKTWDPYYKKRTTKYATGGLNTQTGPAWLDGTFAKPELVLNSKDTANFLELRDLLRALQISIKSPHRDLTDNNKNNGDNYYEIDINVESIADDYDVAKMADKIKKLISQDALYRNGNAINRLR